MAVTTHKKKNTRTRIDTHVHLLTFYTRFGSQHLVSSSQYIVHVIYNPTSARSDARAVHVFGLDASLTLACVGLSPSAKRMSMCEYND